MTPVDLMLDICPKQDNESNDYLGGKGKRCYAQDEAQYGGWCVSCIRDLPWRTFSDYAPLSVSTTYPPSSQLAINHMPIVEVMCGQPA